MPTPSLSGGEDDEEQPDEETENVTDEVVDGVEEELDGEDEETEPEENEDEDDDEEVAEAQMPGDDDEVEEGESGGVLSAIPTKALIVGAAVVVGAVLILWLIRSAGSGGETSPDEAADQPASNEDLQGDAAGDEQYDIDAPDNEPLEEDRQMMGALGMGS